MKRSFQPANTSRSHRAAKPRPAQRITVKQTEITSGARQAQEVVKSLTED